jgi:hypothetical protein
MIPVLVVGALVYRKKHLAREWIAGGVILAGCACYLFSTPPIPHGNPATVLSGSESDKTVIDGLLGTAFLLGYLFFDGLVSTTRKWPFVRVCHLTLYCADPSCLSQRRRCLAK